MNLTGTTGFDLPLGPFQVPLAPYAGGQIVGLKFAFMVKEYATDDDSDAVVSIATDLNAGAGITTAVNGGVLTATVVVPAAVTALLIPGRTYVWACKLMMPAASNACPVLPAACRGLLSLTAGDIGRTS